MAHTAVLGHRLQFGVGAAGASLPVTQRLALDRCDVRKIPTQIAPEQQMRGTVAHDSESVSTGPYTVSGGFEWSPRPDELTTVLPLIFGGTFSLGVLDPALITDGFPFSFDRYTKVNNYASNVITEATFSSAAGQQLKLACSLEGTTEATANAGTFPSLSLSTQPPFTHAMAAITLDSTTFYADQVQVTVRNTVLADRFFNNSYRTETPITDRVVTVSLNVPYDSNAVTKLYEMALAGVAGSIVWTNGGYSLTFSFPCLQAAPENAPSQGKTSELMLPVQMTARTKSGAAITQEIQITLDTSP